MLFQSARQLRLSLSIEQHYYVVRLPGSGTEWGIRLSGYAYALSLEERGEVLAFHWHARTTDRFQAPHLHLRQGASMGSEALARAHVPTRAVLLEDVLCLAIEDLGVRPARADWSDVLDATRASLLADSVS